MANPKKKPAPDRHKPRKMIAIEPKLHAAISALAKRNRRPVTWEIEGILIEAAKKAGLWSGDDFNHDPEPV